ncbi:hypothetical protein [Salicola sp. Rm-C-2C1-2]|uniref:hypothetical protein n=1 Tax=Salicola sp. Rm-C-2C1-2 TaxID=3141321 RepID=UPI0032E384A7
MKRQPDVIRVLVMVFAIGLLISGLTSLATSEEPGMTSRAAQEAALTQSTSSRAIN